MTTNIEYEVLPMTTSSGNTFWFACEILHEESDKIVVLGFGCVDKIDAETILYSFLEG